MKKIIILVFMTLMTLPQISMAQTDAEREKLKEEIRQEMLKEEIRKELEMEREKELELERLEKEKAAIGAEKRALEAEVKMEMDEKDKLKEEIEQKISNEILTVEEAMIQGAETQANWDSKKAEAEQARTDSMDYLLALPVQDPTRVIYDTIRVRSVHGEIADGPARGYQMTIYRAKERNIATGWKQFIKGYKGRMDAKNRDDEYFVDDVFIPSISNVDMDITSTMEEVKGDIVMTSYFDLGGVYLSETQNSEAARSAVKLLRQFGREQMKDVIEQELKDDEKELNKREKDFTQLRKKNENIHGQLEKLKEQISEHEAALQSNLNDQDNTVSRIRDQQTNVRKTQMKRNGVE